MVMAINVPMATVGVKGLITWPDYCIILRSLR